MSKQQPKSEMLFTRVSPEVKAKFTSAADKLDLTASDVVRELVTGFAEGRVTIIPPTDKKESLYNARTED